MGLACAGPLPLLVHHQLAHHAPVAASEHSVSEACDHHHHHCTADESTSADTDGWNATHDDCFLCYQLSQASAVSIVGQLAHVSVTCGWLSPDNLGEVPRALILYPARGPPIC